MHNRVLTLAFIALIISLFTVNLLSVNSNDSRPIAKRIHSIYQYWTNEQFQGTYSSTLSNYFYSSYETPLIDSIQTHSEQSIIDSVTVTESTYSYTHTISISNNQTQIDYFEYTNHSNIPSYHYMFIKDENGRLTTINSAKLLSNGSTDSWWNKNIHYDNSGKPDSIYYEYSAYNTFNIHKYLFSYDINHHLTSVWDYIFYNNQWSPNQRYCQTYADNVIPFNNEVKIFDYGFCALRNNIDFLCNSFDSSYPVYYATSENYSNQAWLYSEYNYYSEVFNNQIHLIESYQGYGGGSQGYYFSDNGLYSYYSYAAGFGEDNGYKSIDWEDYVPNEDEFQETPAQITISVYPNPFKTNLNIIFANKSNVPSDIAIYNIKGQLIRSWKNFKSNELSWDGRDNASLPVSSGMYLIKAKQGKDISTAKVIKY